MIKTPKHPVTGLKTINPTSRLRPALFSACLIPIWLLWLLPSTAAAQLAQNPTTRLQAQFPQDHIIALNGIWDFTPVGGSKTTLQVPGFYVWKSLISSGQHIEAENPPYWRITEGQPEAIYERQFDLPADWSGQRIHLRFESANYMAQVYVNDQFVGEHIGGYTPFEFDITPHVIVPSSGNRLRVVMKYNLAIVKDYSGDQISWPSGYYGAYFNLGLTGEVSIIARPACQIVDQAVQTWVDQGRLHIQTTVINRGTTEATAVLQSRVEDIGWTVDEHPLTLSPQEIKLIDVDIPWTDANRWSPGHPKLYTLHTELQADEVVHAYEQRFGFRELTVEGDHFLLNGTPIHLRGDNIVIDSENTHFTSFVPTPSHWEAIVDSMKALHFNVIRFHQQPAPPWMIDVCDEKGIMVIAESAIFADFFPRSDLFTAHAAQWLGEWVQRDRNHASIVIWSVFNEVLSLNYGRLLFSQVLQLAQAVEAADPSRIRLFEGDGTAKGLSPVTSWHYPVNYPNGWPHDGLDKIFNYTNDRMINALNEPLDTSIPMSVGEFEWHGNGIDLNEIMLRQCVQTRWMRYLGVDDIRPYRLDWAWYPVDMTMDPYQGYRAPASTIRFLKNTMSPAAALDVEYYRLHWSPQPPVYNEGDAVTRQITVFNDDESGEQVRLGWRVLVNGQVREENAVDLNIPLGTSRTVDCTWMAPYVPGDSPFQLQLYTEKGGSCLFSEALAFESKNTGLSPPQAPDQISMEVDAGQARLSWPAVTQNVENQATTVDHYLVTRAGDASFSTASIHWTRQTESPDYSDEIGDLVDESGGMAFYRIQAVDSQGKVSSYSAKMGWYHTPLAPVQGQHLIPLHFEPERTASSLSTTLAEIQSVTRWNGSSQSFETYESGQTAGDFSLPAASACWIQIPGNGDWIQHGRWTDPGYAFTASGSGTAIQGVVLPLNRSAPTTLSHLMDEIPGCDGIALWDAEIQGYRQYVSALPQSDAAVNPGSAFLINVPTAGTWPTAPSVSSGSLIYNAQANTDWGIFHSAMGTVSYTGGGKPNVIQLMASIEGRENELLDQQSLGCGYDAATGAWFVQCGHFSTPWQPGDRLRISLSDGNGNGAQTSLVLTGAPVDAASPLVLTPPMRQVMLKTVPTGLPLQVDGQTVTAPLTLQWAQGSSHTVEADSLIEAVQGTRQRFSAWSENQERRFEVTVEGDDLDLTASFQTEHCVNLVSAYGQTSGGGWHPQGASVQVSIKPTRITQGHSRHRFMGWAGQGTGAFTGSDSLFSLTVSGPVTQTASWASEYFLSITVQPSHAGTVSPPPPGLWVAEGQTQSLIAQPAMPGIITFMGWQGALNSTSANASVFMDGPKSVVALFHVNDSEAPRLTALYPRPGTLAVPQNAPVEIMMQDPYPGSGLDNAQLSLSVGNAIWVDQGNVANDVDLQIQSSDLLTIRGQLNATTESDVVIRIQGGDFANPINRLDSTATFHCLDARLGDLGEILIDPILGGSIQLSETGAECQIPAGALGSLQRVYGGFVQTGTPPMPSGASPLGAVVYFGPDGLTFQDSLTLRIPYALSMLSELGINRPDDLPVYHFSTTDGQWRLLPVERATGTHLYIEAGALGLFCVGNQGQTPVIDSQVALPLHWSISTPYPNPFNETTRFILNVPRPASVTLSVLDCRGRRIRSLMHDHPIPAGRHPIMWNGCDQQETPVSSGVYFIVLQVGSAHEVQKVLKLR